jgi:hypothetical protein
LITIGEPEIGPFVRYFHRTSPVAALKAYRSPVNEPANTRCSKTAGEE